MFRGTFYLFVGQAVFAATSLVFHGFLGRRLVPEEYGVYGILNTIIMFNEILFLRASYEGMSKFIAEDAGSVRSILRAGMKIQAAVGFAVGILLFLLAPPVAALLKDPSLSPYIRMVAFLIPVSGFSFVYLGALNGMRMFGKQSKILMLFSASRLVLVILLVQLGLALTGVLIGLILSGLVQLWALRRYCRPHQERGTFDAGRLNAFVPQLVLNALVSAVLMNIDILATKVLLMNDQLTGYYTSAITITRIPSTFLMSLTMTLFPFVSKSEGENDYAGIKDLVRNSLRYLTILIVPLTFVIMATSRELLVFIYGKPFAAASPVLKILIFGSMILTVKVLLFSVIVAGGRPRSVLFIGLASLVLDVALILLWIGRYDIAGVAAANLVTNLIGLLMTAAYVHRRYGNPFRAFSLLRVAAASAILIYPALLLARSGVPLPLNYAALSVVYLALLVAMKEIDGREIESVRLFCAEKYTMLTQRQ